jgi:CRISPR-associated exonuclease Cas4
MDHSSEYIPISALEHWSYCPRQCGLIHLERTFTDNLYTVRGSHAHERAHEEGSESRPGVRIIRAMPLWSDALGLVGKADVVEMHGDQPYPVEYKVGARQDRAHDDLQLAAQALCLEEMLGFPVERGSIFYRASARRRDVAIDAPLRARVREATAAIRAMLEEEALPPAVYDKRCIRCSLHDACLPRAVAHPRSVLMLQAALFTVSDA